jgi:tRNA modification GTPase
VEDGEIYAKVNHRPLILVINKVDLALPETVNYPSEIQDIVETVAAENQGIDALEMAILKKVQLGKVQAADLDFAINQRQASALVKAQISLQQTQITIEQNLPLDFWTIDLRDAIYALGEITGEEVTESVLERIFARFCIGK